VSAQALSVGISAIPHPSTDAAWGGWLYHTFLFARFDFFIVSGVNPNMMHNIVIDSKAMRKIGEEERLVTVFECTHATQGFNAVSSLRLLSKVH